MLTKTFLSTFAIVPLLLPAALASGDQLNPFGFPLGRSLTETKIKAASCSVAERTGGWRMIYVCKTAPEPLDGAEDYLLDVVEDRIRKVGANFAFANDSAGVKVRAKHAALSEALRRKYGKPQTTYDFISSGSLWHESKYYAMSLKGEDRILSTYWNQPSIGLRAGAVGSDTTTLYLGYEDEDVNALLKQKLKEREDKAL